MLKGITVFLYVKKQVGTDEFNNPIYSTTKKAVNDVLVAPTSNSEVLNNTDLVGKKAIYTLGIPKGNNDHWEDSIVEFNGNKHKTYGYMIEGIEELVPTRWHKKIYCFKYE